MLMTEKQKTYQNGFNISNLALRAQHGKCYVTLENLVSINILLSEKLIPPSTFSLCCDILHLL